MVDFRSLIPWRERTQVPVTRDDFFDPFLSFRREVDRIFDSFFTRLGSTAIDAGSVWTGLSPAVDIAETDKELVITAEVPGVSEKDIDVTFADNVLTIRGEKKAEQEHKNGNFAYAERRYGSFSRSIRLPFEANDEDIEARYDKGVLTVRVPKPASSQNEVKRIEVKAA